jgi:hypothetical protein
MMASSQTVAGDRVADRQREKTERGGHQNDVQHVGAPRMNGLSCRQQMGTSRFQLNVKNRELRVQAPLRVTDRIRIREGCTGQVIGIP